MSASTYVGRIGVLAASLGVGAALFTAPGTAWADSGAQDSPGVSAGAQDSAQASKDDASTAPRQRRGSHAGSAGAQSGSKTRPAAAATPDAAVDLPDAPVPDLTPRRNNDTPAAAAAQKPAAAAAESAADAPDAEPVVGSIPAPAAAAPAIAAPAAALSLPALSPQTLTAPAALVRTATLAKTNNLPSAIATVANQLSTAITSVVANLANTFSGNSPFAPKADGPINWLLLAAARRQPLSAAATTAKQVSAAPAPTLFMLNGYNVVAATPQNVTSFYGPFVNFPGYPGIQSVQEFNLVDPKTKQTVGSFKAFTSEFHAVGTSRQILVSEVLSGTPGVKPGETPPVGSMITSTGDNGNGTVYASMPGPGGGNVVTFKLTSPFGELPNFFTGYDAAKGLSDFVFVNKPINLGEGFSIAPTTPSSEVFEAVTGLPPLFAAIQGTQDYSLLDKDGKPVGSFSGAVTTTSDLLGLYTKAILVTSTGDSTNVGTAPGQVPPVGSVYNLISFSDDFYALYTSMPSKSGDVYTTKVVSPFGNFSIPLPLNASTPPKFTALQVPAGNKFVPASEFVPFGINGLPPREVIIQGYQKFDVVDAFGNKIGNVDADVMRQWDWFGGDSQAILITKVNSGTPGLLAWNVPPVGAVLNFRHPYGINIGLSDFYQSVPTPLGSLVTYLVMTPFGIQPQYLPNDLSAGMKGATYVNPFV